MTVSLILRVNGNYVATMKNPESGQEVSVGPGANGVQAEKYVHFAHGSGVQTYTLEERQATAEEIEAANKPIESSQA